jgi:hypothetical protein
VPRGRRIGLNYGRKVGFGGSASLYDEIAVGSQVRANLW